MNMVWGKVLWREQQAETARLDAKIEANLKELGCGE